MTTSFISPSPPFSFPLTNSHSLISHHHHRRCQQHHISLMSSSSSSSSSLIEPQIFPIRDKRVLFTAPSIYAPRLASSLLNRQARPLHMPTISTLPLRCDQTDELHAAVLTLSDYDIIAFPSRSAIYYFGKALYSALSGPTTEVGEQKQDQQISPSLLLRASGAKIAVLGADALAVRELLQLEADYIPPSATPKSLAQMLSMDEDNHGKHILVPVPLVEGMKEPNVIPDFLKMLREEVKCKVSNIPAYITAPVNFNSLSIELDLLKSNHIDAIIISSIGEAHALYALLDESNLIEHFLDQIQNRQLIIAAHGPVTAHGIQEIFQFENDNQIIVSNDWSSFDGVVNALEGSFIKGSKKNGKLIIDVTI